MGQSLPPSKPRVQVICPLPLMGDSRNDAGRLLWYRGGSNDASLEPAMTNPIYPNCYDAGKE